MYLAVQLVHQRFVHPGPLITKDSTPQIPTPTIDRDRTVSRRSEPSSRTTLIGEQPNPWDLIQPQDVMSRHRGAKPPRRCELLGRSACYPQGNFYPLSDGNSTFYRRITKGPTFVPARPSHVSQLSHLMPLHSSHGFQPTEGTFGRLRYTFGGDRPSQTVRLPLSPSRITAQG